MGKVSPPSAAERRIRFSITQLEYCLKNLQRPCFDDDQRNVIVCDTVRDFAVVMSSLGEAAEMLTRWGLTR